MHDSRRYRSNASECLLASYEARQPCYGKLNFSMAALWLALAGQDEAIDNLFASWDIAEPVKTDGFVLLSPAASGVSTTSPISQSRLVSDLTYWVASERSGTC
jgi:hypothetical protein